MIPGTKLGVLGLVLGLTSSLVLGLMLGLLIFLVLGLVLGLPCCGDVHRAGLGTSLGSCLVAGLGT